MTEGVHGVLALLLDAGQEGWELDSQALWSSDGGEGLSRSKLSTTDVSVLHISCWTDGMWVGGDNEGSHPGEQSDCSGVPVPVSE